MLALSLSKVLLGSKIDPSEGEGERHDYHIYTFKFCPVQVTTVGTGTKLPTSVENVLPCQSP